MSTYLQEVRRLPPPSDAQIFGFIDYVAGAHSWYKHLPLIPPGILFHFFIDPNAGCDLVVESGKTRYRERKEEGFHYSDLPTAEYRQRFGYLQYSASAGTSILVRGPKDVLVVSSARGPVSVVKGAGIWKRLVRWCRSLTGTPAADVESVLGALEAEKPLGPAIQSAAQARIGVPDEILEAGSVKLTGIIHPIASTVWVWRWYLNHPARSGPANLKWPPETGGPETVLKILRFLEENPREKGIDDKPDPELHLFGYNPEIHRLVDPERQRLKKLMEQAIRRVVGLIYASPFAD